MRKIILYISLALSIFWLVQEDSSAISYDGSSIRSYPLSYSSWEFLYHPNYPWYSTDVWQENCLGSYLPYYAPYVFCSVDSSTQRRSTFWYFTEIDVESLTEDSYLPMQNYFDPWFWTSLYLNKDSSGSYNINLKITDSASATLVDSNIWYINSWSSFWSWSLPKRFVFYLSTELSEIKLSDTQWKYYVREVNFCFYINQVAKSVCFTKSYLSETFSNGLLMWVYTAQQNIYSLQWTWLTWRLFDVYYVPPPWHADDPWRKTKWIEFVTWTWSDSMTRWLGWLSSYYVVWWINDNPTWSWVVSTWNELLDSFFTECSSFLDVGCYIKGGLSWLFYIVKLPFQFLLTFLHYVYDWLVLFWGYISDLLHWIYALIHLDTDLFPDSFQTCYIYTGWDSWNWSWTWILDASWASTVTQFVSSWIKKFINIYSLVNPLAPSEWQTLCKLDWSTSVVHYPRESANIVDYLVIFACMFPLIFGASLLRRE